MVGGTLCPGFFFFLVEPATKSGWNAGNVIDYSPLKGEWSVCLFHALLPGLRRDIAIKSSTRVIWRLGCSRGWGLHCFLP